MVAQVVVGPLNVDPSHDGVKGPETVRRAGETVRWLGNHRGRDS